MASYPGSGAYGMGGGYIDFEWVPDPEVIAQELFTAADELEDRSSPIALSQQIALADIRERFDTKTAPSGAAWAEWADSYKAFASAHNVGGILEQTGALRASVTGEGAFPVTADSVFFSTAGMPEMGWWHEEGRERSAGGGAGSTTHAEIAALAKHSGISHAQAKAEIESESIGAVSGVNILPARPFMGLSPGAEAQIIMVFDQWFAGIISLGTSSGGKFYGRHSARGAGGRFVKAV